MTFLSDTKLFQGLSENEIQKLMACLHSRRTMVRAGEYVFWAGNPCEYVAQILSGRLYLEMTDAWGHRALVDAAQPGDIVGEAYACLPSEPMLVSVQAAEDSELLLLRINELFAEEETMSPLRARFARNLLKEMARKNLHLSQRIAHTTPHTIRGRLLSYFSSEAVRQRSQELLLPFGRQELADYLGVDRSALSRELSSMGRDGLITVKGREVRLNLPSEIKGGG